MSANYHEQENEEEEYPPIKGGLRKLLLFVTGIVGFFVFEAVAVPKVRASGGSTDQMFFTIIEGMVAAVILPLILNAVLKRLGLKGKKPHELAQMFIGYQSPYAPVGEFSVPSDAAEWGGVTMGATAYSGTPGMGVVPYGSSEVTRYDDEEYGDEDEEYSDEDEYIDDEGEEVDELIEANGLYLAENFMPDPRSLTCQNIAFVGVRRMGKSNAEAILLRSLAQREFPLLILDTEDEYEELARKRYMPRGVLVGSEQMREDAPTGIRFYAIDQETAYNFGQLVVEQHLQAVVNLKSWSDDAAAVIISELIQGIEDYMQHRSRDDRYPFYVALTEITKWVPQYQGETTLSKDAVKLVQHALFDVTVRRGGKRGFGLIIDGQKYSEIDKRVLQGVWRVIFCQTEKSDLKYCEQQHGLDQAEVQSLQPGESFVFCPQVPRGLYVRWPLSDVPLGGSSPSMDNLDSHRQHISRSVTGVLTKTELQRRLRETANTTRSERDDRGSSAARDDEGEPGESNVRFLHPSQQPQPNSDRQLAWGCAVMHYLNEVQEPFTPTAIRRPRKELHDMALALRVIKADADEIIGGGARAKQIHEEVSRLGAPRMLALLRAATQALNDYQGGPSDQRAESQ